jgi:hypothetical protein
LHNDPVSHFLCVAKRLGELGGKMGLWLDLARNLFLDSRRFFSETYLPCAYKPEGSPTTMCPTLLDVLSNLLMA